MATNTLSLRPEGAVRAGQMNQEILLPIPRQRAPPQHRGRFMAANRAIAHSCQEPRGVCGVLLLAPGNTDAPAGDLEIAVPGTMIRKAGRTLLGQGERATLEMGRKRRRQPHQPLFARLGMPWSSFGRLPTVWRNSAALSARRGARSQPKTPIPKSRKLTPQRKRSHPKSRKLTPQRNRGARWTSGGSSGGCGWRSGRAVLGSGCRIRRSRKGAQPRK